MDDNNLEVLLETYLKKIKNNSLTCDEKLCLINFYIDDNIIKTNKDINDYNDEKIINYFTLGWYISNFYLNI